MKIINRGTPPETKPMRMECNHCKTVVELLPPEARYVSDQRDGDYYSLKCPVCAREMTKAVRS
jgi:hypothetical protein